MSVIGGAGKGSIRTSSSPKSKHLPALVPSPVPAREDVVPNPEVDEALAQALVQVTAFLARVVGKQVPSYPPEPVNGCRDWGNSRPNSNQGEGIAELLGTQLP